MASILGTLAIALALAVETPVADEPSDSIAIREAWRNFFGGQTVEMHLEVRTDKPVNGRLGVALLAPASERPLWRSEVPLQTVAGQAATIAVEVPLPTVKEDVVLPLVFQAQAFGPESAAVTEFETAWWVFGPDPFAGRKQWLESIKLELFDPSGDTADVLEKAGVPFERVRNAAALAELQEGIVLVGEGISLRKNRSLAEAIWQLADRGVGVVCLAPADGEVVLGASEDNPAGTARAMTFRRQDVIGELDKRLDSGAWPSDGRMVAAALTLAARSSSVVARVDSERQGWPWYEASFLVPEPDKAEKEKKESKLIVCGFAIVDRWEATPAPRYLMLRILERMAKPAEPPATASVEPQP